jgi:hypothetical protein
MIQLVWFSLWLLAGLPFATLVKVRKLFASRRSDYAYYLEWKGFPKWRITLGKIVSSSILGATFVLSSLLGEQMVLALGVYLVCSTVAESTVLIGRPHPTPRYKTSKFVCENCRSQRDEECSNVRMLDGFEASFRSSKGRYRPVCCCGFRISEWREATV